MKNEIQIINAPLQLSPIKVNEDYRKEWNINSNDFVCLSRNGELLRDTLYRVGGIGKANLNNSYSMLIKHVESRYDFGFIQKCYPNKSTKELELHIKHLESQWCIIDKNGFEKVNFKQFDSPYLINDSCIYSLNSKYYNIETGYFYGDGHHAFKTDNFVFINDEYNKDESKLGVIKINKKDGTFELFK